MPKPTLKRTLTEVRTVLDDPTSLDQQDLNLLASIHNDIERVLEMSAEIPRPQSDDLEQGLRGAIRRFESTHPSLTRAMSSLAETLSSLGI